MAFVLDSYDSVQAAVAHSDAPFVFTFPDIVDTDSDNDPVAVGDMTGSNAAWNVTLTGFPSGMRVGFGNVGDSANGFFRMTDSRLSSVQMTWTPRTDQSFVINNGRPSRPRVWVVSVQVDGQGPWEDHQWEFGVSITVTDRVLHGVEFPRAKPLDMALHDSIDAYGLRREIGLPWYKFDPDLQTGDDAVPMAYLTEALKRRYLKPPRMLAANIALVQESAADLCTMLGIEVGQSWHVGVSAQDATDQMRGVVTSVEYQIGAGGHGLSFKRVNFIEVFRSGTVLAINTVPLSINGHELAAGG